MRNFKPVTYLLVGLNIFIFIRMFQLYGLSATEPENIYNSGGMFGNLFYQNHEWKRLITPSFVHIGITHLAFNMLALYTASSILEQIYGGIKTLLIYLVTAVTGNVFAAFFHTSHCCSRGIHINFWHVCRLSNLGCNIATRRGKECGHILYWSDINKLSL